MIGVQGLYKDYGSKKALQGIDFSVKEGEIFGLLGPNGAGKTTTLKILTGQLLPTAGGAEVMGQSPWERPDDLRREMGILPEQTNHYERLTVKQNLKLFQRLHGVEGRAVQEIIKEVELESHQNMKAGKLSRGLKQRLLLARTLLHKPRLLFLDEPTGGLDPGSASNLHRLLKKLNQDGITIILTSHNMEEVDRLCGRVAFLDHGQIVAGGSPQELKLQYGEKRLEVMVEEDDGEKLYQLDLNGEESGERVREWMEQSRVLSIHSIEPSLADIFIKVTGREKNDGDVK